MVQEVFNDSGSGNGDQFSFNLEVTACTQDSGSSARVVSLVSWFRFSWVSREARARRHSMSLAERPVVLSYDPSFHPCVLTLGITESCNSVQAPNLFGSELQQLVAFCKGEDRYEKTSSKRPGYSFIQAGQEPKLYHTTHKG